MNRFRIGKEQMMAPQDPAKRNLGEQPISTLMDERGLRNHDLVDASGEQLTHKMVSKARKGRRLTPNVKGKIMRALNQATGEEFSLRDVFNY